MRAAHLLAACLHACLPACCVPRRSPAAAACLLQPQVTYWGERALKLRAMPGGPSPRVHWLQFLACAWGLSSLCWSALLVWFALHPVQPFTWEPAVRL